jgi:aconitate hydratase
VRHFNQCIQPKQIQLKSIDGVYDAVPAVARAYKAAGVASIVVGDHNLAKDLLGACCYGTSFPWVKAVLVKSFARIHETNLKKDC